MGQRRPPRVQHHGHADLGAEMPGIGGDRRKRLGRRLEQRVIDHGLVGIGDVGDRRRQREHDVEIADRQEIGAARLEPGVGSRRLTLRAMAIAAAVESDIDAPAILASGDMAPECCGAARLDRRHHAQLAETEMALIAGAIACSRGAEDVRDLELGSLHRRAPIRRSIVAFPAVRFSPPPRVGAVGGAA